MKFYNLPQLFDNQKNHSCKRKENNTMRAWSFVSCICRKPYTYICITLFVNNYSMFISEHINKITNNAAIKLLFYYPYLLDYVNIA